jgi:tetratricopeptide (TPR) repeat protein
VDEAIAAYRQAIRLKPDYAKAHNNLGLALKAKGQLDEAIAAFRQAIRLQPDHHEAHYSLALALEAKGRVDEAIAAYRQAIRLKKDYPQAHTNLGAALMDQGRLDDAIAEYREALRSKRNFPEAYVAHNNLGIALRGKGKLNEAIVAFRQAIRVKPDYALAHINLGVALKAKGQVDQAIVAYREAIRLKPDYAGAHYYLGLALLSQGRYAEAKAAFDCALALLPERHPRRDEVSGYLQRCERYAKLQERLPRLLQGKDKVTSAQERLDLASMCQFKQMYAAAARFYAEAFAEQPALAANLQAGHRYDAACAAALAGSGKGERGHRLPGQQRRRWRQQALTWLRADLDAWRGLLEKAPAQARPVIVQKMQHWLTDPDFAGVRGAQALANLPKAERHAWQKLWADVADLRDRASATTALQTRPDAK